MRRRSWLLIAVVVGASALGMRGLADALWAVPEPGILGLNETDVITEILPGGGAWRRGVRPGDLVIDIDPGEAPEDWRMTVDRDGQVRTVTVAGMTTDLRGTLPTAMGSAALGLVALLALGFAPPVAAALAAVGAALSEQSIMAAGMPLDSTLLAPVAMLFPAFWLTGWGGHRRLGVAAVLAGAALSAAWVLARLTAPSAWAALDPVRIVVTYGGAAAVLVVSGHREVVGRWEGYDLRRRTDMLVLASTATGALFLASSGAPVEQVVVSAIVVALGYPVLRGRLWLALDRLGFGTIREHARVTAIEEERSRVAREIHDGPIQELAAGAAAIEADPSIDPVWAGRLRATAGQLRGITVRLRSSELEDLGLGAALTALVARFEARNALAVRLELRDSTTRTDRDRIPDEVALAFYRITQEGLINAFRHSGGETVTVRAVITPNRVDLVIADDGVGLDEVTREQALLRGRMGLASMRERARLVGADYDIVSTDEGLEIRVGWQR